MLSKASEAGYKLMGKEENMLPNGKSIITFHFVAGRNYSESHDYIYYSMMT
jgi:hypothetical protein